MIASICKITSAAPPLPISTSRIVASSPGRNSSPGWLSTALIEPSTFTVISNVASTPLPVVDIGDTFVYVIGSPVMPARSALTPPLVTLNSIISPFTIVSPSNSLSL